jgi:probable rRNA maturation factor
MNISLTDQRYSIDKKAMISLIKEIVKRENARAISLEVVYCRDCDMIPLNRRFKGHRGSTDVLAFDLRDPGEKSCMGEVYVNLQMAKRQALENKVTYNEEVRRLTIHGVLHLLGYRDDTPKNRSRMWARQESYLK